MTDDSNSDTDNKRKKDHHRNRKRRRNKERIKDDDDVSSASSNSSSVDDDDSFSYRRRRRQKKRRKKEKKMKKKEKKSKKSKKSRHDRKIEKQTTSRAEEVTPAEQTSVHSDEEGSRAALRETSQGEEQLKEQERREKARKMAPMSREQYETLQSTVREVYDEQSGRYRLVRGTGEIIERIVSRHEHSLINQQATRGDGDCFSRGVFQATKGRR